MSKPEPNSIGAAIAVLVVGLLLLLAVLGGAAIVVGGLFFAKSEAQFTNVESQLSDLAINPFIEIDATGQISIDGEVQTIEQLRSFLQDSPQEGTPLVIADSNCPEDVLAEVSSLCEEVFGSSPDIMREEAGLE